MVINWKKRKESELTQQQKNNQRSSSNPNNSTKTNIIKQATTATTIRLTRRTRQLTEQYLSTNNKQTNWLLALYWINVNHLEIIDGHRIGNVSGTKRLDENKQELEWIFENTFITMAKKQ